MDMDIVEALRQRRSIRVFKPDPVPQEILKEIIELSLRAPSWANTQPWEFAIVGRREVEKIGEAFIEKVKAAEPINPDLAAPREFPEPYNTRRRAIGRQMLEIQGIKREDTEQRMLWGMRGLKLFEAPNVIYIYTDRSFYFQGDSLNVWPIFDCGLVAENIMLLATRYGLGTIPAIQAVAYPDVLRQILGIPDSKLIVLGIAIGYPDWDASVNQLQSDREPVDDVATWYGFD